MAIRETLRETLLRLKNHALFALLAVSLLGFIRFFPRFLTILSFFSPLLLSTVVFLLAILLIKRTYPPAAGRPSLNAGEMCTSDTFDDEGYFENLEGKGDLVESVSEEQEVERLASDDLLK